MKYFIHFQVVKLNIMTFLLEEECYDEISVFDGQSDSASLIGVYCNSRGLESTGPAFRPYSQPVYSTNPLSSLHVVFVSDYSNEIGGNYTGFSVSWETSKISLTKLAKISLSVDTILKC